MSGKSDQSKNKDPIPDNLNNSGLTAIPPSPDLVPGNQLSSQAHTLGQGQRQLPGQGPNQAGNGEVRRQAVKRMHPPYIQKNVQPRQSNSQSICAWLQSRLDKG